jgi:two-component system, response regulator PdtaR
VTVPPEEAHIAELLRGLRVLIVEDEALVCLFLKTMLDDLGCAVIGTAPSGEGALDIAATTGCDLALVDIRLQGPRDGIDTAVALHERFAVPAVFTTGGGDEMLRGRAAAAGSLGFLRKPYTLDDLEAVLQAAVAQLPPRSADHQPPINP